MSPEAIEMPEGMRRLKVRFALQATCCQNKRAGRAPERRVEPRLHPLPDDLRPASFRISVNVAQDEGDSGPSV